MKINSNYLKSTSLKKIGFSAKENQSVDVKENVQIKQIEKTPATDKTQKIYNDPLKKWPLVGLSYFNDIGAVVTGISPKVGYAIRTPAMMYIGADIYDKYKNDNDAYSPSTSRGIKEAVIIAVGGTVIPSFIARLGEKIASTANRISPAGLSTKAKENVLNRSLEYMQANSLHTFVDNVEGYKEGFKKSVAQFAQDAKGEFQALHPIKKVLTVINPFTDTDTIAFAKQSKLDKYAEKQAEKVLLMREQLMQNRRPKGMSKHLFNKFQEIQTDYQRIYPADKYMGKAAKTILKDYHKHQIFTNKLVKTAGGLLLITLMADATNKFVEKYVIKKTVEPGLEFLSNGYANLASYRDKNTEPKIFNCF